MFNGLPMPFLQTEMRRLLLALALTLCIGNVTHADDDFPDRFRGAPMPVKRYLDGARARLEAKKDKFTGQGIDLAFMPLFWSEANGSADAKPVD